MSHQTEASRGKILFGICGSIAAYRSPDLVKTLKKQGFELEVACTQSAEQFVSGKVLETFTGRKVLNHNMFDPDHLGTEHIRWARWAEKVVLYGVTANFLAKLAHGFADDLLSLQLSALSPEVPVYLVPAMNTYMWNNPATQANVALLKERSFHFVGPVEGVLACGEKGIGHIASDDEIVRALEPGEAPKNTQQPVQQSVKKNFWSDKKVLISAGPMRTSLDSVRFLQNSSSGKMGLAMAKAARSHGAKVSILLGPIDPQLKKEFSEFHCIDYTSPEDYEGALDKMFPWSDVFFSAAAVLDFQFKAQSTKISRESLGSKLDVSIESVPDFVKKVARKKSKKQLVVSFSLEQGDLEQCLERARGKLKKKGADFALLNICSESGTSGPNSDTNEMWLLSKDKSEKTVYFAPHQKEELALKIFEHFSTYKKLSKSIFPSLQP